MPLRAAQEKDRHKVLPYTFRHSFATRMLEKGLDPLTVAILFGHQNPAMLSVTCQHLAHNPKFLLEQVRRASA
ncbi:MAG: site-specific integrase [Planctomycetota bacterium]